MSLRFTASGLVALLSAVACGTAQAPADGTGGAAVDSAGSDATGATGGGTSASGGAEASSGGRTAEGGEPASGGTVSSGGTAPGAAVPSAGCELTAPTSGLRTIEVDAAEREYILTLPDDYDPTRPYRLILGFHGAKYDAEWVANGEEPLTGRYFGLADEAEGSAIFVAGQANGGWGSQDLAYVSALLDTLEAELCIDTSRVFATGFSAGGIMTARIGCAMADVFRAIAPMSNSLPSECNGTDEPIAYWSSHGLSDTTITPEQGASARDAFLERNGCDEAWIPAELEGCVSYTGCSSGHPVGYCTFDGEHVPAPFAGEAIWAFFAQF